MAEYDVYQSKFRATEIDDLLTKIQSYDPSALVSPTVNIVESDAGSTITITDKDGDHSTLIKNGAEGPQGDPGQDGEPGQDGTSVTAAIDDTVEGQHTVTLTDKDGDKSFTVKDGTKGSDGSSVTVVTEAIEGGNKVTFTDKDGDKSFDVLNGTKGDKGDEGSSVTVAIDETVEKEHKVTFTDKDGDKEITIKDGTDGKKGDDGVSPTVSTEVIEGGHKLSITDKDGEKSFDIMDGANGEDGEDGSSVTVKVEDVEGGHKITFTDKDGEKSFTVLDGSAVKISEEEGNIIEDKEGLYATVDEDAITENVKKALGDLYLALTGGTVKGVVNISVSNKVNNLFTVKRGTHDNTILASFDGGHVVAGSATQTGYCALSSMRKCANDNNRVNSAAFYCNADGTAIFTHKGGAIGVTGIQNDAWMKFNQNGFQVSYSGEYNKSATEAYTLLDSHNIGNDATIKVLEARIKALEDKV